MKSLLVLAGSSHSKSINRSLANHAASQVPNSEIVELDLNNFEMPLYSQDLEEAEGIPEAAQRFADLVEGSDGIVLSLAEHNGSYSSAFKNVLDWASRVRPKIWSERPMLLMATSPGGRGGATVLAGAEQYFPHMGAEIVATFSLPSFYKNFSEESGILDSGLKTEFDKAVGIFSRMETPKGL